jgi:hypothetical protein
VVRSRHDPQEALRRGYQTVAFGLAEKIGEQRIFPTLPTAVAAYR